MPPGSTWHARCRRVASTLSVMFIPVLGVFSGALWLGEVLHWQDWAAVVLMVVAIALGAVAGCPRRARRKRRDALRAFSGPCARGDRNHSEAADALRAAYQHALDVGGGGGPVISTA